MAAYNKTNAIKIFQGIFQDASAVQIDTCRLAALMVEPHMFTFLANKCSPGQGRDYADNPKLRSQTLNQECMQELQRLHNDANFVPQANASITAYCSDMFISTASPAEQRDYAWICTTFQTIRTTMGTFMSNFSQSGDLANDVNDSARDDKFWNSFCKRQPMWMYIYLLWDHGRESALAWNSILLPKHMSFDMGADDLDVEIVDSDGDSHPATSAIVSTPQVPTGKKSQSKSNKKRDRDSDDVDPLLAISHTILKQLTGDTPSASSHESGRSTACRTEVSTAQAARALSDHADCLRKQIQEVDENDMPGVRQLLTSSLTHVLKKLCALTDAVL